LDFEPEDQAIPKKKSKAHRPLRLQFGALPYRVDGEAGVDVLLVTSRGTKRWIIPKGWPIKGFKPAKTAAREAYEEAGVRGRVAGRALGHYVYEKRLDDRAAPVPCEVRVFPLLVKRQLKTWPECAQRKIQWFPAPEAAALVDDGDLGRMILQLEEQKAAGRRKKDKRQRRRK
jgi:8-oxo-dGTP pyrophosphatase MutT (NUDIX family)